jgi:hypothetical protein
MRMKIYPAANVCHVYLGESAEKPHPIPAFRGLCFDLNQHEENGSECRDAKSGKCPEYALSRWEKTCRLVYSTDVFLALLEGKRSLQV